MLTAIGEPCGDEEEGDEEEGLYYINIHIL
jgi:hypothetical protein